MCPLVDTNVSSGVDFVSQELTQGTSERLLYQGDSF